MMKKKLIHIALTSFLVFAVAATSFAEKKKVFVIDSYHAGYAWNELEIKGVLGVLNVKLNDDGTPDSSASEVDLRIFRMDTKRNTTQEFIRAAALNAKAEIDAWQPDILIALDDNASKYLIAPYFKDTDMPVVFCGVNWDASVYGFPADNVTGMVEVDLIPQMLATLKPYARGERVGLLGPDNISTRKIADQFSQVFQLDLLPRFVTSFEEWQAAYIDFQTSVDMFIFTSGISAFTDWDEAAAAAFVEAETTIPTGIYNDWLAPLALVGYTKVGEEQGEWAAKTALEILSGTSPADIPLAKNTKGKIYLNMHLAEKLGIKFPLKLVKRATLIQ